MSRPALAMITGSYQPGRCGVSDYTSHLCQHLAQHGLSTTVLTTYAAARTHHSADVRGVVDDWSVGDMPTLARAVQALNPALLHIQHAAGSYGFQRALFGLPPLLRLAGWRGRLVTTVHEYGWWEWQPPACSGGTG
ncbi:MAG: hypothetical protein HC893_12265 [Chloroflexaceae bacterium]|nr:hypothetical protein [Chloroflexaceae bacterium]